MFFPISLLCILCAFPSFPVSLVLSPSFLVQWMETGDGRRLTERRLARGWPAGANNKQGSQRSENSRSDAAPIAPMYYSCILHAYMYLYRAQSMSWPGRDLDGPGPDQCWDIKSAPGTTASLCLICSARRAHSERENRV